MRRAFLSLGLLLVAAPVSAIAATAPARPTQLAALAIAMPSEFQSLAAEQHVVADFFFGGRPIGQFEIVAKPAHDAKFGVLVNNSPAGVLHSGERLTVAVIPYTRYTVRIPDRWQLVAFDTKTRTVDVYPGTVAVLACRADPVLAMFGRMVRPDGRAIVNADVGTSGAISATDERGYFRIQAPRDAVLTVRTGDGAICKAAIAAAKNDKVYTALGDLTCRR